MIRNRVNLSTARMMRKFPPPKKPMNNASLDVPMIKLNYVHDEEADVDKVPVELAEEHTLPGEGPDGVDGDIP